MKNISFLCDRKDNNVKYQSWFNFRKVIQIGSNQNFGSIDLILAKAYPIRFASKTSCPIKLAAQSVQLKSEHVVRITHRLRADIFLSWKPTTQLQMKVARLRSASLQCV